MKKITYLLSLLMISIIGSCKKDKMEASSPTIQVTPQYTLKEGININIDDVKKLVPENYKKEKKIVYGNSKGNLMTLGVKYVELNKSPSVYNGINYTHDEFYFHLYSETDKNLSIQFNGGANFAGDTILVKSMIILISPYLLTSIQLDRNGEPAKQFIFGQFSESIVLNGKIFKNVFSDQNEQEKSYSQVCYNSEFGLIAFKDKNGELFVFERFE
jgi:hypothetical protein